MLLLGAGAAVVLGRLRRVRDRQRQLEEQVSRRTAELNSAYRRIAEQNVLLQDLSRTDPLTGLKNRRVLAEQLPSDLAVLRREVQRLPGNRLAEFHGACVYLLDIDDFKSVNDRYGHDVGDGVLTAVAQAIESTLREGDLAVRWGGDEIVVLARAIDDAGAARFANRLLDSIASAEAGPAGSGLRVTASIGFVPCPLARSTSTSSQRWQRVMEVADRLMYRAKFGGRGRACGLARTAEIAEDADEEVLLDALIESLDRLPRGLALVVLTPESAPPGDPGSDPT